MDGLVLVADQSKNKWHRGVPPKNFKEIMSCLVQLREAVTQERNQEIQKLKTVIEQAKAKAAQTEADVEK
tara:strand:- start:82 stop:291 length:210 start_codon:yes stop_codon:yes gene_type:complete